MALLTNPKNEWIRLMLSAEQYKPGKGALVRNGTLIVAVLIIVAGMHAWSQTHTDPMVRWGAPVIVGGLLGWVVYRLINYQPFAEFLINTEAEINKVTWPTKKEVKASTAVTVVLVVMMGVFLFVADTFWKWMLTMLGILKIGGLFGGGGSGM